MLLLTRCGIGVEYDIFIWEGIWSSSVYSIQKSRNTCITVSLLHTWGRHCCWGTPTTKLVDPGDNIDALKSLGVCNLWNSLIEILKLINKKVHFFFARKNDILPFIFRRLHQFSLRSFLYVRSNYWQNRRIISW